VPYRQARDARAAKLCVIRREALLGKGLRAMGDCPCDFQKDV
jgi:hypothetical protein